jgi:hypothetical protein
MLICFTFPVWPLTIVTELRETLKVFARTRINSSLAAPSTGGAAILTRNEPLYSPTTSLLDDRGTT